MIVPPSPIDQVEAEQQFCKAKLLLSELLQSPEILKELENEGRANAKLVYGKAPTLWLLILQRLHGGLTLERAVKCLLEEHRELLPENRRVVDGTLSGNTSAYNRARKTIPLDVVERFSNLICNHLAERADPAFLGRRVFILDGTTITLPPTPELKKHFPPAQNQHGESVWPIALLLVAHELQTGCALVPQVDPMYGPNNSSEVKQAARAIAQLPSNSIVMADSGFGIFQVAWSCVSEDHEFLFRLSKTRFKSHLKQAALVDEGEGYRTYHLFWKPSKKERQSNPHFPADASIEVFLHQVDLENGDTLELISNIQVDATTVAQLYQRRYDVEFDIRDIKVTMDTERIRAKSVDTVMKELLGSIIAYNLVTQFRRQAAKLIRVPPRKLSFTGVWLIFEIDLLQAKLDTLEDCQLAYQRALINATKKRLPERKEKRSYPRVAHPRRPKTTKFQKQQAKQKSKQTNQPPATSPPN